MNRTRRVRQKSGSAEDGDELWTGEQVELAVDMAEAQRFANGDESLRPQPVNVDPAGQARGPERQNRGGYGIQTSNGFRRVNEQDAATRFDHSRHLAQRPVKVRDMFDRMERDDGVEPAVWEIQRGGVHDPRAVGHRQCYCLRVDVDTDHVQTAIGQMFDEVTAPATDLQDGGSRRRPQMLQDGAQVAAVPPVGEGQPAGRVGDGSTLLRHEDS